LFCLFFLFPAVVVVVTCKQLVCCQSHSGDTYAIKHWVQHKGLTRVCFSFRLASVCDRLRRVELE